MTCRNVLRHIAKRLRAAVPTVYPGAVEQHAEDMDQAAPLIHVGRQPIYDRIGDVMAYELLFRDTRQATRATQRSAEATGRVIISAFTEFGLERIVGARACFINVTREFLVGELPVPFEPNQSVLEIVETVDVDDAVMAGVRDLVQSGYTIALDDFTPGSQEVLLQFATYVKIDLLDLDPAVVAETIDLCRRHPHVLLIAERLETEDDLQTAFALGFEYFQGHILGKPHVVSMATMSPARVNRMHLLVALSADDVDFDQVVESIGRDPALSFRLLQAVNSAASGLGTRVSSVREAAVLLGLATVQHWVTLMLVSDLADATEDQLAITMTRARACRTVAQRLGLPADSAFTVGLLSAFAQITAQPSAELARRLPLSADVSQALADGSGKLGGVLQVVLEYEAGDPAALTELLGPHDAIKAYLSAVEWSTDVLRGAHVASCRPAAMAGTSSD